MVSLPCNWLIQLCRGIFTLHQWSYAQNWLGERASCCPDGCLTYTSIAARLCPRLSLQTR